MAKTKEEKAAYMKTYMKTYRANANNTEKLKAHNKTYYIANKEKYAAYYKTYRSANKEKIKEFQKSYRSTPIGKKSNLISRWKIVGVIGDLSKIYDERYVPSTNCEVCNKVYGSSKDRHLDHDHITGAFRQILCTSCNAHDSWKNKLTCQPCNMPNNWRNIYYKT